MRVSEMLRAKNQQAVTDENLICREFENKGKVTVTFHTTLELNNAHLRERESERVKTCRPGERVFLTHCYYVAYTPDQSPITGAFYFGEKMKRNQQ